MAPFRPSRTTRSSRPGGNIDDNLFLDGLPVRQWRQQDATVGAPENYQAAAGSLKAVDGVADALPEGWAERPMPKGSESYAPYSQMLLRAARMGKYVRSETGPRWGWAEGRADDKDQVNGYHTDERKQKEGAESGTHSPQRNLKRKASAEGFVAKRWGLIPREQEPAEERQYLAKRREGLPPLNGVYYNRSVYGVAAGATTYGADGQVIANGEPTKRKGPPPRKKHKKGPGRGHKKVVVPLGENGANGVDGSTVDAVTNTDGDVKMGDADEHEDEGEGEEGSEEEDGEEGDDEDGEGHEDTGMQNTPQSRTERGHEDTPAAVDTKLESQPEPEAEPKEASPPPIIQEVVAEEALAPAPPVDPAPPSGSEVETIPIAQLEDKAEAQLQARTAEEPEQMQIDTEADAPVEAPVEIAPQSVAEPAVEPTEQPTVEPTILPDGPVVVTGSAVSEAVHERADVSEIPIEKSPADAEPVPPVGKSPEEPEALEPPPAAPVEAILNSPKAAAPMDAILNSPEPERPQKEDEAHIDTAAPTEDRPEEITDKATPEASETVPAESAPTEAPSLPPVERPEMESLTPPPAPPSVIAAAETVSDATEKPKLPIPAHVAMPQPAEVQSPAVEVERSFPSPLEEVPPQTVEEGENKDPDNAAVNGLPQLIHQVSETESPPADSAPKDAGAANDVAVEELPPAQES